MIHACKSKGESMGERLCLVNAEWRTNQKAPEPPHSRLCNLHRTSSYYTWYYGQNPKFLKFQVIFINVLK
jgi:hypothetical protein